MNLSYDELLAKVNVTFGLSDAELKNLQTSPVPRLAALLPAIAGFPDADRFGLIGLSSYVLGVRNPDVFGARASDCSAVDRRSITYPRPQKGYNKNTFKYGIDLLTLIMLNDYAVDVADDKAKGKFNPITDAGWNISTKKAEALWITNIRRLFLSNEDKAALDAIVTVGGATAYDPGW